MYFCIDTDSRKPEVLEYDGDALKEDMDFFGVAKPLELDTYDRRVFDSEAAATQWLARFSKIADWLSLYKKNPNVINSQVCLGRELPNMIYKRHYLVQTMMGEKLQTVRGYQKPWQPGQLFNLYDQTFFLTVKLRRIVNFDGEFKYEFDNLTPAERRQPRK